METIAIVVICVLSVLVIAAGVGGGFLAYHLLKRRAEKARSDAASIVSEAHTAAEEILKRARSEAERAQADGKANAELAISRAKLEAQSVRTAAEAEGQQVRLAAQSEAEKIRSQAKREGDEMVAARTAELAVQARKLDDREAGIQRRDDALTAREAEVEKLKADTKAKAESLQALETQLNTRQESIEGELCRVAHLSQEDARREVLAKAEERSAVEVAELLKTRHDEAEDKAEETARTILANAMERYSQDVAIERTTTTVALPSDEMKGRIIGREGRNIKSLEAILGVDILIDDTPEALTVSCFNPIRREAAVRTLQVLIKDGRIQPGRIEETYAKIKKSLDDEIRHIGEEVVMRLGLPKINRDLCYYIGRLKYRTSFTQNALEHCIQVGELCGMIAAELGLDQTLAKRCGLLHDIGKAADFELEGSHVEIGARLAKKYGEPPEVISAISSHHGDCEKKYIYDVLVVAADTLSAARPGARSETLENYIQRVADIERICTSYEGVQSCYAFQSGRDVRITVYPEKIDDRGITLLAQQIRDRIQSEMTYPGNIKITVIRESRASETAR